MSRVTHTQEIYFRFFQAGYWVSRKFPLSSWYLKRIHFFIDFCFASSIYCAFDRTLLMTLLKLLSKKPFFHIFRFKFFVYRFFKLTLIPAPLFLIRDLTFSVQTHPTILYQIVSWWFEAIFPCFYLGSTQARWKPLTNSGERKFDWSSPGEMESQWETESKLVWQWCL